MPWRKYFNPNARILKIVHKYIFTYLQNVLLKKWKTTGSYSEASGGRLSSLQPLAPPTRNVEKNRKCRKFIIFFSEMSVEKKIVKIFSKFSFRFFKKKSVEIRRLCMQNFMIICQGVPEISVRTNRQTQVEDLLYRLVRLFFTRLLRHQKKVMG